MVLRFFYCFLLIAILPSLAQAANLVAQVDRETLSLNESFRLVLAVDETASENIDFSQLTSQFDIVNQQRSQRRQIINGQVRSLTQWILILAPKEEGVLLIPSFRYKDVFSNPIEITVETAKTSDDSQSSAVFLEITADKESAYVQEQILLKTRLYYNISLSSYEAPELKLKDATVEKVNEVTYKTTVNNERYQVLEQIHALYPQASGEIQIPALRWRLEKPSRGFFDRSGNPYLFVQSNTLNLNIKAIPTQNTASTWLPTTALTLTPKWQTPPLQARVGEPLSLSLTLAANGLSAAQLPEISLPSMDGLQVFADSPTTDDIKSGSGIIGSRNSQFAIIPQNTGTLLLPAITLKWWNVRTDAEEIITLPEQQITVSASALKQETLPTIPSINAPVDNLTSANKAHTSFWQAIVFLLLLIGGSLYYWFYYRQARWVGTSTPNNSNDKSQITIQRSENNTLKQLKHCIEHQQFALLPQLVIQWGQLFLDDKSIKTTWQLLEKLPELKDDLAQLDSYLYQPSTQSQWEPKRLLETIMAIKKKPVKNTKTALKPLYQ